MSILRFDSVSELFPRINILCLFYLFQNSTHLIFETVNKIVDTLFCRLGATVVRLWWAVNDGAIFESACERLKIPNAVLITQSEITALFSGYDVFLLGLNKKVKQVGGLAKKSYLFARFQRRARSFIQAKC